MVFHQSRNISCLGSVGWRQEEATKYHLLLLQVFCLANKRMSMGSGSWEMQGAAASFWANFLLEKKRRRKEVLKCTVVSSSVLAAQLRISI